MATGDTCVADSVDTVHHEMDSMVCIYINDHVYLSGHQ